jgi:hypothetical protein
MEVIVFNATFGVSFEGLLFMGVSFLIPCDVCMGYKLHGCMLVIGFV